MIHSHRSGHFADPSLRAVLESSLTPDDNDLFLGNLEGKHVLALHGGADENVPTWHTRALVSTAKKVTSDKQGTEIEYVEMEGKPHWYPGYFQMRQVDKFIARATALPKTVGVLGTVVRTFTLTVVVPEESGSMFGWAISQTDVTGRLVACTVPTYNRSRIRSI